MGRKNFHPQIYTFCTLLALTFVSGHKSEAKQQVYELWKMRDDRDD